MNAIATEIFSHAMPQYHDKEYSITPLEQRSANALFLVTTNQNQPKYVIKLYVDQNRRAVPSREQEIHQLLDKRSKHVNPLTAFGVFNDIKYTISKFVQGEQLLSIVTSSEGDNESISTYAEQIKEFLKECSVHTCNGFGALNSSGSGNLSTWSDFLLDNLQGLDGHFSKLANKYDADILKKLNQYLEKSRNFIRSNQDSYFSKITSRLTPVDLNLTNFLIEPSNKLIVIDMEAFVGGDFLFAYGELFAHVYHTPFGRFFEDIFLSFDAHEKSIVHLYSLISNLNVFCFCALHGDINPSTLKPWGNSNTFFELMKMHSEKIENF